MSEITLGIRLTADGKNLVGEVRVSKDAIEKLGGEGPKAAGKIERAAKRMRDAFRTVGRRARAVARGVGKIAAPLAAIGGAAVKTGADFDESLAKIVGLVGVSREQVQAWRGDILDLGVATGKGPGELAEAMFFVTSAGARGQEALDILTASAKAARAGLGETATVADAVTSAMNAYGGASLDAGKATGILVAAVREGKSEASAIAGSLGKVLPIASELGVGFDQVAASVAAMTRLGLDADESTTALRGTLAAMLRPTGGAKKTLEEFGLSAEGVRRQLREDGLLATLEALRDAFGDNEEALAQVFPDLSGLTGVLNLVGKNAETTREIFDSLAKAGAEDLDRAFKVLDETINSKIGKSLAGLSKVLIRISDEIAPSVASAIDLVTDSLNKAADILPVLVDSFGRMADAIVAKVGEKTAAITGFFSDMWRKVAGESYVPDMVDAIARDFGRLDRVMVDPARDAAAAVSAAFGDVSGPIVAQGASRKVGGGRVAPAFLHGGSFIVPGAGPPDSTVVRFSATPGERVDVLTPAQQSAGLRQGAGPSGSPLSFRVNIDARGAEAGVETRIRRIVARLENSLPAIIRDAEEDTSLRQGAVLGRL